MGAKDSTKSKETKVHLPKQDTLVPGIITLNGPNDIDNVKYVIRSSLDNLRLESKKKLYEFMNQGGFNPKVPSISSSSIGTDKFTNPFVFTDSTFGVGNYPVANYGIPLGSQLQQQARPKQATLVAKKDNGKTDSANDKGKVPVKKANATNKAKAAKPIKKPASSQKKPPGLGTPVNLGQSNDKIWEFSGSSKPPGNPEMNTAKASEIQINSDGCYILSNQQVKDIFPNGKKATIKDFTSDLNKYSAKYGIENKEALEHFLGQVGGETSGLGGSLIEDMDYKEDRLKVVFPKYFASRKDKKTKTIKPPLYDPKEYAHNAEKLGNLVYAKHGGYKYRGRGIIQLTGEKQYKDFFDYYNKTYNAHLDYTSETDLDKVGNDMNIAVISGLWFYQNNVLDSDIDIKNASVEDVTQIVNGGQNGIKERRQYYKKAVDGLTYPSP